MRSEFEEIYKRHHVDIVGFWENSEDPTEAFYISRYKNEDHYKKTVEKLKSDEQYAKLTKELGKMRVENHTTRMAPKWIPEPDCS
jgi:hypothetical protein